MKINQVLKINNTNTHTYTAKPIVLNACEHKWQAKKKKKIMKIDHKYTTNELDIK